MKDRYVAIDLFSGCGGLTQGMRDADFQVKLAVELEAHAIDTYKLNHRKTEVIPKSIREVTSEEIFAKLKGQRIHLLAGCPPCQGFSTMRKLNQRGSIRDTRNNLVLDYFRLVKELEPLTIMMENVPGLKDYYLFKKVVRDLKKLGYNTSIEIVNVKDYGVAQSRKRLVMVGSLLGPIQVAEGIREKVTVRMKIGSLPKPERATDPLQQIIAKHSPKVLERIRLVPKNGGSRKDLPEEYTLDCHKKKGVGFRDVYGRLSWDDYSTTITSGCLNPSKGRFLHPEQDRVITPREAALLQSFPIGYIFPKKTPKSALALLIGNALPPKFSYLQSINIANHLSTHIG